MALARPAQQFSCDSDFVPEASADRLPSCGRGPLSRALSRATAAGSPRAVWRAPRPARSAEEGPPVKGECPADGRGSNGVAGAGREADAAWDGGGSAGEGGGDKLGGAAVYPDWSSTHTDWPII